MLRRLLIPGFSSDETMRLSLSVTAEGLGTQGEGIARCDGITLFVPYLLKGERARVKILKVKDKTGYAKAEEIITPAEERTPTM